MANEIQVDYESGSTLYAVVRDRAGRVWCADQQVFEDWGSSGRTAADYDIPLNDKGGSHYVGGLAGDIPEGRHCVQVFLQAGAVPADTDALVAAREIVWTGAGELTAFKILANTAVQDVVTGDIDYYDDDGQTVLFTHTPLEDKSTFTRLRT